jgi:hypothetical protein
MVARLSFIGCSLVCVLGGCADVSTQVKTRAAREFACNEAQTQIVDAEAGVYRVAGCGLEASYQCSEDRTLHTVCQRLYLSKAGEPLPGKSEASATLAKSP